MPLRDDVLNDSLNVMLDRVRDAYPGIDVYGQINYLGDLVMVDMTLKRGMVVVPAFYRFDANDLDSDDRDAVRRCCDLALDQVEDGLVSLIRSRFQAEPKE